MLPVQLAASRTRLITSSTATVAVTRTRGSSPARSRVTNDTSASGSGPADSLFAPLVSLSASMRCGLNGGILADSSEVESDRLVSTFTSMRLRTTSRLPMRVMFEVGITWRATLASPTGGSLSLLRDVLLSATTLGCPS